MNVDRINLLPRSVRRNNLRSKGLLKHWGMVPYLRRRSGTLIKWDPAMDTSKAEEQANGA